jgi:hypothetical protein
MPRSAGSQHVAPRTIEHDVPCAGCRYNLRGLNADGPCAECGLPVFRSFAPERLIFASQRWLTIVRCGLIVLLLTPPITVLTVIGATLWFELMVHRYPSSRMFGLVLPAILIAALWAAVAGVWLATRGDAFSRSHRMGRWVARVGALILASFFTVIFAVDFIEPLRRLLDRTFSVVPAELVIPPVLVLAAAAVLVGVAGVIAGLARRARPARGLRRWALINLALVVALIGLTACVGGLAIIERLGVPLISGRVFEKLGMALVLSWAGAALSMLGLCGAAALALRRESRAAQDPALASPAVPSLH